MSTAKERNNFISSFDALTRDAGHIAQTSGWTKGNDGEAIALMHAELSEALEWNRNGNPVSDHIPDFSGEEEEFADVIIRIMHYASLRELDIPKAILAKMAFNATREHKHGGKEY